MAKNKLSIYLIKEEIKEEEVFEKDSGVMILEQYSDKKKLYYLQSWVHEPNWLKSFFNLECDELKQANSKAILLNKLEVNGKERIFAIAFGYAKNLFAEDVLEEQFGLKIVLNSVGVNDIRKISKVSVGTNQKQSQEQMPKATNINEFGFDLDRDLITNVTGKCDDEIFENTNLVGGDIFSVLAERNIDNIDEFLKYCYKKFKETRYKENFEWIDNIKEVKSKSEKEKLDKTLVEHITKSQFDCVWMSIPEVINWEGVKGFKYTNEDTIYDDIFIEKFIESIGRGVENVGQIRTRSVRMFDIEDNEINKWSAYRCINAEIQLGENSYCLNNGKWYYINKDFSNKIENEYKNIKLSEISFIDYKEENSNEDKYNEALTKSIDGYLIHKIGEISFGGGTGNRIELCDVMTKNNELIYVKKNGGSAYLSHLFNQAAVSAELLLDNNFREKVNEKMIANKFNKTFTMDFRPSDYTIIIGIINKYHDERPKIPFFSKVSLGYTIKNMRNYGYKVQLKNIKKV